MVWVCCAASICVKAWIIAPGGAMDAKENAERHEPTDEHGKAANSVSLPCEARGSAAKRRCLLMRRSHGTSHMRSHALGGCLTGLYVGGATLALNLKGNNTHFWGVCE